MLPVTSLICFVVVSGALHVSVGIEETASSKTSYADSIGTALNGAVNVSTTTASLSVATTTPVAVVEGSPLIDVKSSGAASGDLCSTDMCRATAKSYLDDMNATADPCDDFYDYACGNWIASHEIPDGKNTQDKFRMLAERVLLVKQAMLQSKQPPTFDAEAKAKALFSQCLNEDDIEKWGVGPLLDLLNELLGGWPILNPTWNASTFNLLSVLNHSRLTQEQQFFTMTAEVSLADSVNYVIDIDEPKEVVSREVLESERGPEVIEDYIKLVTDVTSFLLLSQNSTRTVNDVAISKGISDIVESMRYFATSRRTAAEKLDISAGKNIQTIQQVQNSSNFRSSVLANLTSFAQAVFGAAGVDVSADTRAVNWSPSYLQKLDSKLHETEQLGEEGKRRMANIVGWMIISGNQAFLPKKLRQAFDMATAQLAGIQKVVDVSPLERCSKYLTQIMPLAVNAMFINLNASRNAETKEKALAMVSDLRDQVEELLRQATWMDSTTAQSAFVKIHEVFKMVAFPDLAKLNISTIDQQYRDIVLQPSYFKTVQLARQNANMLNLRRLPQHTDRTNPLDAVYDITVINAFADLGKNAIVVPLAILDLPFFHPDYPSYFSYGCAGSFIGHEITHHLDSKGAQFDNNGIMRNWWLNDTWTKYKERQESLVLQYNNYSLPVGNVNGQLTAGENVADNAGLKAAYMAFKASQLRSSTSLQTLPGLEKFSPDQLFFLAAAQAWCERRTPKKQRILLLTNNHSPNMFRVIGTMSNMPEFGKAFNCRAGSRMNPIIRAGVW